VNVTISVAVFGSKPLAAVDKEAMVLFTKDLGNLVGNIAEQIKVEEGNIIVVVEECNDDSCPVTFPHKVRSMMFEKPISDDQLLGLSNLISRNISTRDNRLLVLGEDRDMK